MRDIRTMNMTTRQKIENDEVMKRIGDLSYRNLGSLIGMSLYDEGKALVLDGLRVTTGTTGGMNILVGSGTVFQRADTNILPCIQTSDIPIVLDAANGASRIDIIEAQVVDVADKNDYAQIASIITSGTSQYIDIDLGLIKRDIKYYVNARKQTNTTLSTSGTSGILTGTVDCTTIDLSAQYLINIADGEDGSFQEIDCRGAIPLVTTRAEIINNLNVAMGRAIASIGAGGTIILTGNGVGKSSKFVIKAPVTDPDKDALEIIFGLSVGGTYKYTYQGLDPWFKLAEIDIGAATTVITSAMIRNIDQRSTWANEATDIHTSFTQINVEKINGTYNVSTQAEFTCLIERVSANIYQFKSAVTSVLFNILSGGYITYGATSFLSGGDTWGRLRTNQCTSVVFTNGAYLNVGDYPFYIESNTERGLLKNADLNGIGSSAAALTASFLLNADYVTYDNCITRNRKTNNPFAGFVESTTASHNNTATYKNCKTYSLSGVGYRNGFSYCQNLVNCFEDGAKKAVQKRWTSARFVESGLVISTASGPCICTMNETDIAFIDGTNDELRCYRFNGISSTVTWSLIGSGLAIATVGDTVALCTLNTTDVAFIDETNDELRCYRFNGSTWSLVGSGLSITGAWRVALCALNTTDVAYFDATNHELRCYRFNGSTWSLVGSGLSITAGVPSLSRLNATDISFIDASSDTISCYRFNGSTWSLIGTPLSLLTSSLYASCSLNETDIIVNTGTIKIYRFNGSTWISVGLPNYLQLAAGTICALNGIYCAFIEGTVKTLRLLEYSFYV